MFTSKLLKISLVFINRVSIYYMILYGRSIRQNNKLNLKLNDLMSIYKYFIPYYYYPNHII